MEYKELWFELKEWINKEVDSNTNEKQNILLMIYGKMLELEKSNVIEFRESKRNTDPPDPK